MYNVINNDNLNISNVKQFDCVSQGLYIQQKT